MKTDLNINARFLNRPCAGRPLLVVTLGLFLIIGTDAQTQYPPPPYPYPAAPPPPALTGSSAGANMRNAASATLAQAAMVRNTANAWSRRANSATYRIEHFQLDYSGMQFQFGELRNQFNWLGTLAGSLKQSRAQNVVAELDAGLTTIAELFTFLESQYNAGTLDRNTIVRSARAFEDAIREWERELRKNSSRLGLAW